MNKWMFFKFIFQTHHCLMTDITDELVMHVAQIDKYYGRIMNYLKKASNNNTDQFIFSTPENASNKGKMFIDRTTNIFDQMDHDLNLCREYINIQIKHQIEEEKSKFI